MKCDICRKRQAVFFIHSLSSNLHLCEICAEKHGYRPEVKINPEKQGTSLSAIFAGIFNAETEHTKDSETCAFCGISRAEIRKTGRVGCARCYEQFFTDIASRRRSEGGVLTYTGTIPEVYEEIPPAKTESGAGLPENAGEKSAAERNDARKSPAQENIVKLRKDLESSLSREDYERAALLRDKIKLLESARGE